MIVDQTAQLAETGYVVFKGLFDDATTTAARRTVLSHIELFRNTRPNPSSGHLAGFHRYATLEALHTLIATQPDILALVRAVTDCPDIRTIGLSDITINRSQEWHVDLLRGKYRQHLSPDLCWGADGGGVYKVLWYLQPGRSLRVLPGAHLSPRPLEHDGSSEPADPGQARQIVLDAGDMILMDLRLPHRGSSEAELAGNEHQLTPKILVSTVLGAASKAMTRAMEVGNFERLMDWDNRHQAHRYDASLAGTMR
jgi:hypothetical protein